MIRRSQYRAMNRRLLDHLALCSLLLCVAVVMLWLRSHRVGSVVGYYAGLTGDGWYRSVSVGSCDGRITLVPLHSKFDHGLGLGRFHAWDDARSVPQAIPGWAGFGYRHTQGREIGWMEFPALVRHITARRVFDGLPRPRPAAKIRPHRLPDSHAMNRDDGEVRGSIAVSPLEQPRWPQPSIA